MLTALSSALSAQCFSLLTVYRFYNLRRHIVAAEGRHQVGALRFAAQLLEQLNGDLDAGPGALVTGPFYPGFNGVRDVNAGHFVVQKGSMALAV